MKKIEKPPKAGGLTRTEGSEKEDVTLDCKDCGPPKVEKKIPKVGGPFKKGHSVYILLCSKKSIVNFDCLKTFKPSRVEQFDTYNNSHPVSADFMKDIATTRRNGTREIR